MKLRHFVTGWAKLRIRGNMPERIGTAAVCCGTAIWDIGPVRDFSMELYTRWRDRETICRLAQRMGLEAEILASGGLPSVWQRLRRRKLLLGAMLCCCLFLGLGRMFISRVTVETCAGVSESELRSALREAGIDVGCLRYGLSQDLVRNKLLARLPNLRWATVNIRGSTAHVIVRPKRMAAPTVKETEYADIRAACAGYVTEVRALRGDAAVQPGDSVLPGDILIEGIARGRCGDHGAVRAMGTVYARCWYELSAAVPEKTTEFTLGRCVCRRWALIIGKRRINFFKDCSICPGSCVKMVSGAEQSAFPLRIVREEIYETDTQSHTDPYAVSSAAEQLRQRLNTLIGDDGEILQSSIRQSSSAGWVYVTLSAECHCSIGETAERENFIPTKDDIP